MSAETTLTPRQQIVDLLSSDLVALGWNQPNKMWYVKGESGDEWLELVGTFKGAPENHMIELISKGDKPDDVTGLVIATEGWTYPQSLMATFKSEAALRAFWRLSPPDKHPQRVELRQILSIHQDGDVLNLVVHNAPDVEKRWAHIDGNTPSPTGDRTVDAARGFLGINEAIVSRVRAQNDVLGPIQKIAASIQKALSGELDADQATLDVFEAMPESAKEEMVRNMPDQLKDVLRRLLPPEDHQKYGL